MARQPGLFDFADRLRRLSDIGDQLEAFAAVVDFEMFRPELVAALNYSDGAKGGRPPFDPVLMFKILVIQAQNNLSDDRAEFLINDRLSFMRFLGLGLTDKVPAAKTIWAFRERLTKAGAIGALFARFDRAIREAGYIPMSGQIVDASLVSAPKQRNTDPEKKAIKEGRIPEEWKANPAKLRQKDRDARWTLVFGKARLREDGTRHADIAVHLNLAYRWFCRLDLADRVSDHSTFPKNRHGPFRLRSAASRLRGDGAARHRGGAGRRRAVRRRRQPDRGGCHQAAFDRTRGLGLAAIDPDTAPRAIREYLAVLDDAAFGGASPVEPKFTSPVDPAAQWTGALKGRAFFAYATNYLVDTDNAIIVDIETTRAIRQAEVGAGRTMIDRTMDRFGLYPERLIADSAYGSAPMLGWLVEECGTEPHIPVFDKSGRSDGTFERADFAYDRHPDAYVGPQGPGAMSLREAGS